MPQGKKNQYTCDTCGGVITTVDLDDGTTPMFLNCRALEGCPGRSRSSMYQVDQDLTPTHEWYKPAKPPKGEMWQHVKMGGLLIRPVAVTAEEKLCVCGCGKPVPSHANFADVACVLRAFKQSPELAAVMGESTIDQAIELMKDKKVHITQVPKVRKGFDGSKHKGKKSKRW